MVDFELKAFTLLKNLGIDDNKVRMRMQIDSFKPWCNVAENEEWKYKPHYAHAEVDGWMDDFEKEKQWYAYLDLCFQNRFIYLNQVEFFPGVFDIGVFCKHKVPLKFLYTTKTTTNWLSMW